MNGTKQIAQRIINAEDGFAETIVRIIGCSDEAARKITALYLHEKIAKLDAVGGRITVKHGAFLEHDVLKRALDQIS